MKKTTLALFVLLVFGIGAQAQKSAAILRGGVNLANVSNNDNGGYDDNRMLTSFQVGVIGDLNITEFLAIQPGILYTGKGIKWENNTQKLQLNPRYLEVPVNLVFKTPTGAAKFFVGAGPYVAMGVGGKFKADGLLNFEDNIQFSDDDPLTSEEEGAGAFIMRRFDYGLNGTVGIEASNLVISANYGLGLAKLQSGSDSGSDQSNKHRVLSFTLGFRF